MNNYTDCSNSENSCRVEYFHPNFRRMNREGERRGRFIEVPFALTHRTVESLYHENEINRMCQFYLE